MKFNKKQLTGAASAMAGVAVGSIGGRIASDKLKGVLKDDKIRNGVLFGVGLLASAMIPNKSEVEQLGQGVGVGLASVSALALAKSFIQPKADSMLAVGLGKPEPVTVVVNTNDLYDYDYNGGGQLASPYYEEDGGIMLGYATEENNAFPTT